MKLQLRPLPSSTMRAGSPIRMTQKLPVEAPSTAAFTAISSLSIAINYCDRSAIATAIVPMAEQYHYSTGDQGIILGAFFVGYALTQASAGWLADRVGGRNVLIAALAGWSLLTLATPAAAASGLTALLATRVCLGLAEGFAFPSVHSLISNVVPSTQQSAVVATVTAASYAGTAFAFAIAPPIIAARSWQDVYLFFGGVSLVLVPAWLLFPSAKLRGTRVRDEGEGAAPGPGLVKSLRRLLSYREVWAIIAAQSGQSVGMYGLLNWLPTYLHDRYDVPVEDLAGLTATPYVLQGIVGVGAGFLADKLIADSGWSVKKVRQVLQAVGMLGPAFFLALAARYADSASSASILLALGSSAGALTLGSVSVNHLDIAPSAAGLTFAIGNTAATLAALLAVPLTGWLLETSASWDGVFALFITAYVAGCLLWLAWVGDTDLLERAEVSSAEED